MDDQGHLVRVLTLNCWGIPYVSKDRKERMKAIASYLSRGKHDIVCLQEVWSEYDYFLLRDEAKLALPHSHYFYSGVCGSGVCILSRWPIEEVFFHAWALNGYIHMIHHGDWFGGKGVGFCKIKYNDLNIHVYSAHLHAEYSTEDIYLAHRVLQAFDTAEFIKMTSSCADLVILAGDLNTQPSDLAFSLMCRTGKLNDSCVEYKLKGEQRYDKEDVTLGTNERLCNSYSDQVECAKNPEGKRIDYILYHEGDNYNVQVERYDLPLLGTVPGCKFSYSDHEAVSAHLLITNKKTADGKKIENVPNLHYEEALSKALLVCRDAKSTLSYSAKKYLIYSLSLFLLLLSTVGMAETTYVDIPRLLLVVVMFYFLIMATIWNRIEWNGVLSGQKAMEIIYQTLQNELKKKNDERGVF